jgi:ribosome biogenesis protein BMS1
MTPCCLQVFGDFEDMETSERVAGGAAAGTDAVAAAAQRAISDAAAEMERIKAAKAAKKATFDAAYDHKGEGGPPEEEAGSSGGEEAGEGEGATRKKGKSGAQGRYARARWTG